MSEQAIAKAEAETDATGSGPGDAPPFRYNAQVADMIELSWQDRWDNEGTFNCPNPVGQLAPGYERMAGKQKVFVLDMFPCPSGTGIHVGHPLGYIATDVYARFLRMTGHHVLHTMGYDSFGLPAEQYALETGQHPQVTTRENIANMRRQLRRLGIGYDPRRSVETTDPAYYRWTQWIFLKIYESWVDEQTGKARPIAELISEFASGHRPVPDGRTWADLTEDQQRSLIDGHRLAYISHELVNWCPQLGTVLANEEVTADGRSNVGDFPVYRRPLRQWMMRITAMAQRLIDDLDELDWPASMKQLQRNWIGASAGATISLPLEHTAADQAANSIDVFTTRPDTIAGATYVVLAPEHPLVATLLADAWPDGTPQAWRYPQGQRADADGASADHGSAVWLPAEAIGAYRSATSRISERQRAAAGAKSGVFTGTFAVNPATAERMPIFVADYVLMGYGTGAIMGVPAHDQRDYDFASEFGLPVRPVIAADGSYINGPGPQLAGLDIPAAIDRAISWLERGGYGSGSHSYRLRDWLYSRQRYWGEPFPIVYDDKDAPVALPEQALPVLLPEMTEFRPDPDQDPDSDPVPPLARATHWAITELDLGHGVQRYRRELNTMPQWAGSCWYYLRYLDPLNDVAFVDPEVERYWMTTPGSPPGDGGVDLYVGGVEHAVLHLLYSRFWHKVLFDLGLVSTREPFSRLFNQGYIQADAFIDERGFYVPAAQVTQADDGSDSYQGRPVTRRSGKMGKSLKNGVSPDEMYQQYGADTLRLYEMASGPLDASRPWRPADIIGVHRFLQRLWRCIIDEQTGRVTVRDEALTPEGSRALHRAIAAVREDFGQLRFNTAVARLMELTSVAARISAADGAVPRALAEPMVLMVAPLAPHVAEELWGRLGHQESLAYADFPQADPDLARAQTVTMPVQVNGRTRFRIEVPAESASEAIELAVTTHPDFAHHTKEGSVERLVIVPGRIVNIVLR